MVRYKERNYVLITVSSNNSFYNVTLNNYTGKRKKKQTFALNCRSIKCIKLWHKHFGHQNSDAIKQLVNEILADSTAIDNCENCIKNKLSKFPYAKEL